MEPTGAWHDLHDRVLTEEEVRDSLRGAPTHEGSGVTCSVEVD